MSRKHQKSCRGVLKPTLSNMELKRNSKCQEVRNILEREPSYSWDLPTCTACSLLPCPSSWENTQLHALLGRTRCDITIQYGPTENGDQKLPSMQKHKRCLPREGLALPPSPPCQPKQQRKMGLAKLEAEPWDAAWLPHSDLNQHKQLQVWSVICQKCLSNTMQLLGKQTSGTLQEWPSNTAQNRHGSLNLGGRGETPNQKKKKNPALICTLHLHYQPYSAQHCLASPSGPFNPHTVHECWLSSPQGPAHSGSLSFSTQYEELLTAGSLSLNYDTEHLFSTLERTVCLGGRGGGGKRRCWGGG